ncbi:hypothetical protein BH11ARM2_BH11ARM2_39750 [soil metagenome]
MIETKTPEAVRYELPSSDAAWGHVLEPNVSDEAKRFIQAYEALGASFPRLLHEIGCRFIEDFSRIDVTLYTSPVDGEQNLEVSLWPQRPTFARKEVEGRLYTLTGDWCEQIGEDAYLAYFVVERRPYASHQG